MSKIGKNIRKIRGLKKLSQTDFAKLFSLSRTSVGAYEEGRAEPKINTIIEIANHFGVSVDILLNKDVTVNQLSKFDIFTSSDQITPISTPVFGGTIPIVNKDEAPNYINNYDDKNYLLRLPSIYLPLKKRSSLCAFAMNSNGMQHEHGGIYFNDIVIARKIPEIDEKFLHVNEIYVIVLQEKITIRRLVEKRSPLIFKGDNSNYHETKIPIEGILEVWQVEGYYTSNLYRPSVLETRIDRVETEVNQLREQIELLRQTQT